jgi:WD40 repeat protein
MPLSAPVLVGQMMYPVAGLALLVTLSLALACTAPPTGHADNVYAVSADGKHLVSASEDNTAILWDADKLTPRLALAHDSPVYDAAFLPDGKAVVTADGGGAVTAWDAATGKKRRGFAGFTGAAYSVAVSPDGRLVAAGGGEDDPTVRVWDAATGKVRAAFAGHTKPVYGVAFHPTKPVLASASSDGTVRLWDLDGGKHRTLRGHTSHVYRCAFSPDGKRLASAGGDGTVRVWDATGGEEVAVLKGSKDPVYAVAFSPDGKRLVAGGEGRVVRTWAVPGFAAGSPIAVPGRKPVYAVAFVGQKVLTGGGDHQLHRLDE